MAGAIKGLRRGLRLPGEGLRRAPGPSRAESERWHFRHSEGGLFGLFRRNACEPDFWAPKHSRRTSKEGKNGVKETVGVGLNYAKRGDSGRLEGTIYISIC
jgi:hypothetical protein